MKFWKLISACTAFVLSTRVNAALVDNGIYTTDTLSRLDWLDLSVTKGLTLADAVAANDG